MILRVKILVYLVKSQIYEIFPDSTCASIHEAEKKKIPVGTEPR